MGWIEMACRAIAGSPLAKRCRRFATSRGCHVAEAKVYFE